MAKKKKQQTVLSDVNPIVDLTFDDPLFALAAHPTQPLLLSGLGTGHVYLHKYNVKKLEQQLQKNLELSKQEDGEVSVKKKKQAFWSVLNAQDEAINDEKLVETMWKTKRHKQGCRTVLFDPNDEGKTIYTIGKDNIIKKAFTETGKVDFKKNITDDLITDDLMKNGVSCGILSTSHPHLITGDELGNIRVFDTRNKFAKVFELKNVHEDMINQIIAIPNASSVYHYISVGSTTVAKIDLRKGVLLQSENQEDEVVCGAFPSMNSNETLLCGMGLGVVTQWKERKNDYADQFSRIKVSKDNSVDCIISGMNDEEPDCVWAGCSDGLIYKVNGKRSAVVETRLHDELDEVNLLDIDHEYRLISAGMSSLKIWSNRMPGEVLQEITGGDSDSSDNDDSSEASNDDWDDMSDSDGDLDDMSKAEDDDDDEEEEAPETQKKRVSEKDDQDKPEAKKQKVEEETEKPEPKKKQKVQQVKLPKKTLASLKEKHENGIKKFDDL